MAIKHENGKVTGTITLRKLFKKIRKFFKHLWYKIILVFNKDSDKVPDKFKKKLKKERKKRKNSDKFSDFPWYYRLILRISGCYNLNVNEAEAVPA